MAAMKDIFHQRFRWWRYHKEKDEKALSLTLKEPLELSNRRMENAGVKNCQRPGEIKRGLPPLSAQGEY